MGTLNDEILRVTGGPTVPDGLKAFYLSRGAVGTNVNDQEVAYLRTRAGVTYGPRGDMWMQYLSGKGYVGTVNDMQLQWWTANAPI